MRFFSLLAKPNFTGARATRRPNSQTQISQWVILVTVSLCLQLAGPVMAQSKDQKETPEPQVPVLAEASEEGEQAIAGFKYPKTLDAKLFAAEPMVGNPVALHVDYKGQLFVAETYRQSKGVEDNRSHADWLDEDLAAQTVQDRIDYIRKHIPDADKSYTEFDDRIRLLKDTDRDGVADSTTVFAKGFNRIEMGTGAGVLSYRGNVYYTCIPELFMLKDTDNDGVSDVRKSLHDGYGVRFAFRGHDMHGLIVGHDGRLYFSIGDRGYKVKTKDREFHDPASGAVFRCELDGSKLEVIATGLRNPQELAFDNYGNLFTGDNNSDSGDKARWVNIVPGSDSGWRMYYQYLSDRGPFNREKIWHPYDKDVTPAYIVPPVDNISDGPSGLAFYPGTGLNDFFTDRFFLCDFRGGPSNSGIRTFRSVQKGAFWEIKDMDKTFWRMLVTDADFGPDGKLYAADWVTGWEGVNKGRVYTFEDSKATSSDVVKSTAKILAEGVGKDPKRLSELMAHPDRRIRLEAQFAAVENLHIGMMQNAINFDTRQIARLHSMWGMTQLVRTKFRGTLPPELDQCLTQATQSADYQTRATAIETLGELRVASSDPTARKMLKDKNLRVRYKAAMALAKVGTGNSLAELTAFLAVNKNEDPMIRHGGIMALTGILGRMTPEMRSKSLKKLRENNIAAVRLATVVAMRKLFRPDPLKNIITEQQLTKLTENVDLGGFLADKDPAVVLEAARAIHDLPVPSAMPALAAMPMTAETDDPLLRRIMNANVVLGADENAKRLAKFILLDQANMDRRKDAIIALANWAEPQPRDLVLGDWRPIKKRDAKIARDSLEQNFAGIAAEPKLTEAALEAAGKLGLTAIAPSLAKIANDPKAEEAVRAGAIDSLTAMKYEKLGDVVEGMKGSVPSSTLKIDNAVSRAAATMDPKLATELIQKIIEAKAEGFRHQQEAYDTLGTMKDADSAALLVKGLNEIKSGKMSMVRSETALDVLDAAALRSEDEIKTGLTEYWDSLAKPDNAAAVYSNALVGGDYEKGKQIFFGKTEVSCVRCHKVDGQGGEVGPDLSSVGLARKRDYLLESMVVPNKDIAEGFAQQIIVTADGDQLTGIVKQENDTEVVLMDADGKLIKVDKDSIDGRKTGKSSMPEDLVKQLSQSEIRDLVEYLVWRRTKPAGDSGDHGEK